MRGTTGTVVHAAARVGPDDPRARRPGRPRPRGARLRHHVPARGRRRRRQDHGPGEPHPRPRPDRPRHPRPHRRDHLHGEGRPRAEAAPARRHRGRPGGAHTRRKSASASWPRFVSTRTAAVPKHPEPELAREGAGFCIVEDEPGALELEPQAQDLGLAGAETSRNQAVIERPPPPTAHRPRPEERTRGASLRRRRRAGRRSGRRERAGSGADRPSRDR